MLVDDRMRTDDPDILAAGDVAEYGGQLAGPVADRGRPGRGRGRHASAGGEKTYRGIAGDDPQGRRHRAGARSGALRTHRRDDEVIALEATRGTKYRKLVIADGRIVGAILLGYGREVAPVRAAITSGPTSRRT